MTPMPRYSRTVVIALLAILSGLGGGWWLSDKLSRQDGAQHGLPPVVRVNTIVGKVVEPATRAGKIKERIVYRTVQPTHTQVAPVTETTIEQERKNNGERLDQVSLRGKTLEVYTHSDSEEKKHVFKDVKGPFDVTLRDGQPHVRIPRCTVCEPVLAAEGGYSWSQEPSPYVAMDASVAVVNRDFRVFIRPEVSVADAQVKIGARYTF